MMSISKDVALNLYYKILRIRLVEEEVAKRYSQQQMRCPVHLSIGQEATPVGVCENLTVEDGMVGTHRAHAHYLAKGGDLKALIAELHGKVDGCSRGQGGSMHLIDLKAGFVGATSIVGGTVPVGVGLAFATVLKKKNNVTVIGLGDTVLEEGVFHESANFAALKNLPVLFMCENNRYSCYSPLSNRQPDRPLTDVSFAHRMTHHQIDGNNVFEVYEKTRLIIQQLREGRGPIFVEFPTYRFVEHCGPNNDDSLNYRDQNELQFWKSNDPITKAKDILIRQGWLDEIADKQFIEKIMREVNEAFDFSENSHFPEARELGAYIYA